MVGGGAGLDFGEHFGASFTRCANALPSIDTQIAGRPSAIASAGQAG
jgi:hypothetical protein